MFPNGRTPSVQEFIAALVSAQGDLSEIDLKILRTQYSSPGRAVTSQEIRDSLEYSRIGASNLAYGRLGKKLGIRLGFDVGDYPANRPGWWRAVATSDKVGDHYTWVLRPQLASALEYTGIVNPETDGLIDAPDVDLPRNLVDIATEGRVILVQHLRRERNRSIVAAKKSAAVSLACEVCGFNSSEFYGIDYCEAHHLCSLSSTQDEVETSLDDLALVCANCHRIIHSAYPALSLEAVRRMIDERRQAKCKDADI